MSECKHHFGMWGTDWGQVIKTCSQCGISHYDYLIEENADLRAQLEKANMALEKINNIRNSIVGMQKINWSEHIYPLVAALNEAGLKGMGYPAAMPYYGTRLERTVKAEQECSNLQARFTAPIVCMCGSTKFKQAWIAENARLTLDDNIVLSVGMFAHADGQMTKLEANGSKIRLDDLHKRKINLCDWVWVLDVGGYIGESTKSEIAYAEKLGKPIRYLSQEYPEYVEPIDNLQAANVALRGALQHARKYIGQQYPKTLERIDQALSTTPTEAGERVRGLVKIIEKGIGAFINTDHFDDYGHVNVFEQATCALLEDALAKYRGGK